MRAAWRDFVVHHRGALGSPSTTTSVTTSGGSPSSQGRQFTVGELGQPTTATLVLSEVMTHYR